MAEKRLALLYLIDSLCHYGNKQNIRVYLDHVAGTIVNLLPYFKKADSERTLKVPTTPPRPLPLSAPAAPAARCTMDCSRRRRRNY